MSRFRFFTSCAVLILLSSCGAPRIDGSSIDKARESIGAVRRSAGSEREKDFDRALQFVMSSGGSDLPTLRDPSVRRRIDGKTSDEIIASAAALRENLKKSAHEREVQRQLAEVKESLNRITSADHPANVASPRAEPTGADPAGSGESSDDAPVTNDPFILQNCKMSAGDNPWAQHQCQESELKAKITLDRGLPADLSKEIGSRIRISCAHKFPFLLRGRVVCEAEDARMIRFLQAHPEGMSRLPPEVRSELETIMK
jgi:hypothetical protein